jgi:nucleotide-binding universal stress UspA family protein
MAPITHVLCPVDFSDASRHAVDQAAAIARWYHARLTALHVYPPLFMPVPALPAPPNSARTSSCAWAGPPVRS